MKPLATPAPRVEPATVEAQLRASAATAGRAPQSEPTAGAVVPPQGMYAVFRCMLLYSTTGMTMMMMHIMADALCALTRPSMTYLLFHHALSVLLAKKPSNPRWHTKTTACTRRRTL